MNVSLKDLIGQYVYKNKNDEPCGKVKGVYFSTYGNMVSSVSVETLSLIPVSCTVPINEITDIGDRKLILQSELSLNKGMDSLMVDKTLKTVYKNGKYGKIKDMRFDFETGEITDVIIGNGVFRRDKKISVNETHIKENTIYIE